MTPDEYQSAAMEMAVYPGGQSFRGLQYATLGLSSEAGEVAGVVKKLIRDKGYTPTTLGLASEDSAVLAKELGDVLWYVAAVADEIGYTMHELMELNLNKLSSRRSRGTLGGNGDDR